MARAKGTVLLTLVKTLRANAERSRQLLPANLHHYLEERIVQAAWYPLEDHLAMLRILPKLFPKAGADFFVQVGRATAKEQMSGVYGRLAGDTSRKAIGTLLAAMFDTGERMTLQGFDDVVARHSRCRAEGGTVCRWEITWKSRSKE